VIREFLISFWALSGKTDRQKIDARRNIFLLIINIEVPGGLNP